MNRILRAALGLFAVLLMASSANAQNFWGADYWQPRASTVGESHARGLADVTRAAGQANLLNSKAAQEYEKARSLYLDNRLKGTNYFFEMRRVNKQARAEENPKPSTEQVYRLASMRAPKRLSTQEVAHSGEISWPKLLQLDEFEKSREELESAFADRAKNGQADVKSYLAIQQTTQTMEAMLKSMIRDVPPMDYTTAKSFLGRLANEARFTTEKK